MRIAKNGVRSIKALLDSNVVIAMVAEAHSWHDRASRLLQNEGSRYGIAAHSYAEAYSQLTKPGPNGQFQLDPGDCWAALQRVAALSNLLGISAGQSFNAVGSYAAIGGVGARLYDRLIGEVAVVYGIGRIVTINVRHMRSLFPSLAIVDPVEELSA